MAHDVLLRQWFGLIKIWIKVVLRLNLIVKCYDHPPVHCYAQSKSINIFSMITEWASHPRPPDFHVDLWGNSRDHPCGNFLVISLRKWRGIFYVDISAFFSCGIPGDISTWKFPLCFPQNFKWQFNDIGRVPVMWKYPRDDLMSSFGD